MPKIVILFLNPKAHEKALEWKKELVKKIEEAIENIENEILGKKIKVFQSKDFTVNIEPS